MRMPRFRHLAVTLLPLLTFAACSTAEDPGGGFSYSTKDSGKTDSAGDSGSSDGPTPVADDSGTDTHTPPDDTSTPPDDTGFPPDDTGTPPTDTGPVTPPPDATPGGVGYPCTSDGDCTSTSGFCSATGFTSGPLYPSPVCISTGCDAGDGTKIMTCETSGVCLSAGSSTICLPECEFDSSSTPPSGCAGNDACNVYGWGADSSGKTIGVGYCFGGCKSNFDCPSGSVCQTEDGLCVTSKTSYTKTLGTACTSADATAPAKCNCLYATSTGSGYCSQFCKIGDSCPTGYTCDAELPTKDLLKGTALFTTTPTGMAANCLKNCTTDADCSALGGYCDQSAGVASKTCHIGKRPCASSTDCPTGKTCTGATTTTLGTCG